MSKKTFSIISLGCFRNTYDSEVIASDLLKKGYRFRDDLAGVQVLLVNTCGFITSAKEESLDVIRQALRLKRAGKVKTVVVRGCLVKRYLSQLRKHFPGVDEWGATVPFPEKEVFSPGTLTPAHLAFVKIAEGCWHRCSYCAIPLIKGGFRSRPQKDIFREVETLDASGVREVNIIGQDVTSWGRDLSPQKSLVWLLNGILRRTRKIDWFRLLYTHPKLMTDELIELISSQPRLCKYIDLPIQHVNDKILKLMNRSVTKKQILSLIEKIRKKIPGAAIRTSLIVGFPGEGETEFGELKRFVRDMQLDHVGIFTFSREEGTAAYDLTPRVHYRTKERRRNELLELQRTIARNLNHRFLGKKIEVLIDLKKPDEILGRTQYQCFDVDGVVYVRDKMVTKGGIFSLEVVDTLEYDLVAG